MSLLLQLGAPLSVLKVCIEIFTVGIGLARGTSKEIQCAWIALDKINKTCFPLTCFLRPPFQALAGATLIVTAVTVHLET